MTCYQGPIHTQLTYIHWKCVILTGKWQYSLPPQQLIYQDTLRWISMNLHELLPLHSFHWQVGVQSASKCSVMRGEDIKPCINRNWSPLYALNFLFTAAYLLFEIGNSSSQAHFQALTVGWPSIIASTPFIDLLFPASFSCFQFIKPLKFPVPAK